MNEAFVTHAAAILAETSSGLSGSRIAEISASYAVCFDVDIPYASYPFPNTIPNKRTALRSNLMAFHPEHRFIIIKELCDLPTFEGNRAAKHLKMRLISDYGALYSDTVLGESEIVQEAAHWLTPYPDALRLFEEALLKFEGGTFERNVLDDIRLCFESLLKSILENRKSLENQEREIGKKLEYAGVSPELRNMFMKVLDYYANYQNTYVKHNDDVKSSEVGFVIELTSLMMQFILKTI